MNRSLTLSTSIIILAVLSTCAAGQEQPEFPGPQKEHEWLQKFAGTWATMSKMSMGPDQPQIECSGTITSRMIGGFWVVNEMKSVVQGTPMQALQTIGYDSAKKKYIGTWIDSMINHQWLYEGSIDETGKRLTLEADGPNFMAGGKLTKFRDAYEFKSPDHIIATSSMLGEDGKWVTFATGESKRTKSAANR